jgi:hypothetical protein
MRKVKRGPNGVPEHDQLPPVPDNDKAGQTVQCVSVHSFSRVSKDIASVTSQVHFQVFAIHPQLRPLVLRVFLFGASWLFGRGFCQLSVG